MEYIIVLIISVLAILIIKFALNVKARDLKKVKELGYSKKLNDITDKLPENKEVCESILKQLGNESVTIEINDDKESKLSYYMAMTNHIIIANIKDTFTRIQTIAHECIHSTQDRRMLLFNFIFSNIYIIYFIIISILTICGIVKYKMAQIVILTILGFIYYAVRSYLETDAMTKAPYVAKQYMQDNDKLSNDELEEVMRNYNELNKIGIPMTNFQLALSAITKIIIYCVIAIIFR